MTLVPLHQSFQMEGRATVLHGLFDGINILFKEKNKWSNKSRPVMFLSFKFNGLINAFCMDISEAVSGFKRLMGRPMGVLSVDQISSSQT